MTQILFFADCMLGTLAKQLRLCGYDASYFKETKNLNLEKICSQENRILITRNSKYKDCENMKNPALKLEVSSQRGKNYSNVVFHPRAEARGIQGDFLIKVCFIKSNHLKEQLKQIFEEFNLNYNNLFSRCLICNVNIEKIEKDKVQGLVPEYVLKIHDKFSYCPECKRIYWCGSHYFRMREKFFRLIGKGG